MPRKAFVFGFCFVVFYYPRKIHIINGFIQTFFASIYPQKHHKAETRHKVWFLVMTRKQKQFDRFNSVNLGKYLALKNAKKHKQLVPLSKRTAKKDKHSCHKARAWRCKGTFAVSAKQVKLSKIDWI